MIRIGTRLIALSSTGQPLNTFEVTDVQGDQATIYNSTGFYALDVKTMRIVSEGIEGLWELARATPELEAEGKRNMQEAQEFMESLKKAQQA